MTEQELNLNLSYLQAELARMDVLLAREVHRWQRAGQDPTDVFRGLYVSDAEAQGLAARPLGMSWGQTVALDPAEDENLSRAELQAEEERDRRAETAKQQSVHLRLLDLKQTFGLDAFEFDAFLICLAPSIDLRYERLYGYLQDDVTRKRPTVNLVLNLLADPGIGRLAALAHFGADSPLVRYHLLERVQEPGMAHPSGLNQVLAPDPGVVAWLLGDYAPAVEWREFVQVVTPGDRVEDALLPPRAISALEQALATRPLVSFYGPDELAQQLGAEWMAAKLQQPLLQVDLSQTSKAGFASEQVLRMLLRDAQMTRSIPFVKGWVSAEDPIAPNTWHDFLSYPGIVVLSGRAPYYRSAQEHPRVCEIVEFPRPNYREREQWWCQELERIVPGSSVRIEGVAGQFALTGAQIRDAAATARDLAHQRAAPVQEQDLYAAARLRSAGRLSELARRIECRYAWQDIVLPPDQLEILKEIIATVRGRPQVLLDWGAGEKLVAGSGITVLFAGPPGTGKTMAAEIVAGALNLDLYKIDLSTIVSKYIGETEKNLERIFREAEDSNAILFFDEADALFGKRSEVRDSHDRYANIEISYLLQRMEAYAGVSILATNLRSNLDEAFTRRLQFAVDFPFPDEADRLRIWQTLIPPELPRENDLDFAFLARRFKIAGGNIRNIIVGAAYLAAADGGQVTMDHLLHSTRRELQKMGRLVEEH